MAGYSATPTQAIDETNDSTLKSIMANRSVRNGMRLGVSYLVLALGTIFMLFPVIWMATSALKPEWQIFSRPPNLIPQYWHKVDAGESVRLLNLWNATDPDTGENRETLRLTGRRYSSVIAVADMPEISSVPQDELGESTPQAINDTLVNVRDWQGKQVVALSRDGDNLLVIPFDELETVFELPLDQINRGDRQRGEIGGYALQSRLIELENGDIVDLFPLGPQSQLFTVVDKEAATDAIIVPVEDVQEADVISIDRTEAQAYTLISDESGTQYVLIDETNWRPTLQEAALEEHAFTASEAKINFDDDPMVFNLSIFPVGTVEDGTGTEQRVAMILRQEVSENDNVLVMPVSQMGTVKLAPSDSLLRPYPETINGSVVRVKDFTLATVNEESLNFERLGDVVGIIGDRQDMAILIPIDSIQHAYDVSPDNISRRTSISFLWSNFLDALTREQGGANFLTFTKNSVIITGASILGHMFSVTVVAYAFARMRAPGKNFLFGLVLATMMLPEFVTLVPVYTIFRDLGMIDTLWPMFLRTWFGNAFLIFLLRQFFTSIPMELEEAARIDGANRLQIFFRIMLPLITPALATIAIFTFLWSWNDLFHATIFLNTPQNYTVAIGLKQFQGQFESEFNLLMAAASLVMLPTVLLFFFAQRYFIEGITVTGLKG